MNEDTYIVLSELLQMAFQIDGVALAYYAAQCCAEEKKTGVNVGDESHVVDWAHKSHLA